MKKRGSVFLTVFVIAAAIAVFVLFSADDGAVSEEVTSTLPDHYGESISTALYAALESSGTTGAYLLSGDGFLDHDNGFWMSYSLNNAPSVDEVKAMLGEEIKDLMNQYLDELDGSEIGGLSMEIDCEIVDVVIDVDESGVFAGEYDDGFFVTAIATGNIKIGDDDEQTFKETNFKVPIDNWRFWYMYRIMHAWIVENELTSNACNSMPQYGIRGSGSCMHTALDAGSAEEIIERAVDLLKSSMDDDVACTYDILCNKVKTEVVPVSESCPDQPHHSDPGESCPGNCASTGCEYDNIVEDCLTGACDDPNCPDNDDPDLVPPCMEQEEILFSAGEYEGEYGDMIYLGECFGMGTTYTWSIIAEISCIDNKNSAPVTADGFDNLEMNMRIHSYFDTRFHESYYNGCTYDIMCTQGAAADGGDAPTENQGGSSSPTRPSSAP